VHAHSRRNLQFEFRFAYQCLNIAASHMKISEGTRESIPAARVCWHDPIVYFGSKLQFNGLIVSKQAPVRMATSPSSSGEECLER
jgi:hypothetical protein